MAHTPGPVAPRPGQSFATLGLTSLLFLASPTLAEADEAVPRQPKATWLGLTTGLPVPVGGIVGVQLHQRFGAIEFAEVGLATSLFLTGAYLTWGHHLSDDTYTLLGVDASFLRWTGEGTDVINPDFTPGLSLLRTDRTPSQYIPGVHVGYGTEWWDDSKRLSLAVCVGLPWLGGLRLGVSW